MRSFVVHILSEEPISEELSDRIVAAGHRAMEDVQPIGDYRVGFEKPFKSENKEVDGETFYNACVAVGVGTKYFGIARGRDSGNIIEVPRV